MKILNKLKIWWIWNRPRITTARRKFRELNKFSVALEKLDNSFMWMILRPVVYSLEELKNNTWDKDRVERMQSYIIDNFKVGENENE